MRKQCLLVLFLPFFLLAGNASTAEFPRWQSLQRQLAEVRGAPDSAQYQYRGLQRPLGSRRNVLPHLDRPPELRQRPGGDLDGPLTGEEVTFSQQKPSSGSRLSRHRRLCRSQMWKSFYETASP
jgi:hypothetical protein